MVESAASQRGAAKPDDKVLVYILDAEATRKIAQENERLTVALKQIRKLLREYGFTHHAGFGKVARKIIREALRAPVSEANTPNGDTP